MNEIDAWIEPAPDAYVAMHKSMKGCWPREDEKVGKYNPQQLAQRALQFLNDHPSVKGAENVFSSLADLVNAGLAPAEMRNGISAVAAKLWPYLPSSVLDFADFVVPTLSRDNVKTIFTGKQPGGGSPPDLKAIMEKIARSADTAAAVAYATDILGVPPKELEEQPDGVFRLWMAALGPREPEAAKSLFLNDSFNDEQRLRLVQYSVARAIELGLPTFIEILPAVCRRGGNELDALVSRLETIEGLAQSSAARSQLSLAFIAALPSLSNESLSSLAHGIHRLGGGGALERAKDVVHAMDESQLSVLAKVFPSSKAFSKGA